MRLTISSGDVLLLQYNSKLLGPHMIAKRETANIFSCLKDQTAFSFVDILNLGK